MKSAARGTWRGPCAHAGWGAGALCGRCVGGYGRIGAARTEVLHGALAGLSAGERAVLRTIIGKILVGLMREPGAVRWMYRLCDIGVCRGAAGGCPVGNAARERYLS